MPSRFSITPRVTPASGFIVCPQYRTRLSCEMRRSWARRCHRFARRSWAPATCSADLGSGVLAAATLPGPGAGSKSCCPFTESGRRHRAPPATVRAGAGAPAGPGPFGPGPSALLSSTRASGPPRGPGTPAEPATTTTATVSPRATNPSRAAATASNRPSRAAGQLRAARPRPERRNRLRRAAVSAAAELDRPSLPSKGRKPSSPPALAAHPRDDEGRSRSFASSLAGEPPTAERAAGAVEPGTAPPTAPAADTANPRRPP